VKEYLYACKGMLRHAGVFSVVANVLLLALPLYMLQVYDRVLTSRSLETLVVLTLVALGCVAVAATLDVIRGRLLIASAAGMDALSGKVFAVALDRAVAPGADRTMAELRDVQSLRAFLSGPAMLALFDLPWVPVMLVLVFLFHPLLGAVGLAGILLIVALTIWEARAMAPHLRESVRSARRANGFAEQAARAAETVAALGMRRAVAARWAGLQAQVTGDLVRSSQQAGAALAAARFVRLALQVVILGVGAYLVIKQAATPGVMIAATIVFARAVAPVEQAVSAWRGLAEARAAYLRLAALVADSPARPRFELPAPQGAFSADHVGFRYHPDRWALHDVSVALAPGEVLGVLGPSASGKSTFARIASGIWRPHAGFARLDGADLATWDPEALGQHVGYLPQAVELFGGKVAENIARMSGGADQAAAVVVAAKRAHVHDLILTLPEGYESDIGDGGSRLSGGQRQRIALARALFGAPRLVVLDEPNASLDSSGDEALMAALRGLREAGVTVILVTHRVQLLQQADKLLLLSRGRVERYGPRDEVIAGMGRGAERVRRIARAPGSAGGQASAGGE
jgi:PrtD family type I secretion system ABC transporter